MFLKRIKLVNFGNVSNQELIFSEGITVFSGENGEGKSTVLRAISLALYNRFPLTLKDYIQWGKSYFEIEIDFNHNAEEYNLYVKYDGGTQRILKDSNDESWEASSVIEKLDEILDLKRAIASTISFEHEIDLITTSPAERREYLKGIYDLNFKKQIEIIETDITEATNKINQMEGEILSLESQKFEKLLLQRKPFSEEENEKKKLVKSNIEKEIHSYEQKILELKELKTSLVQKERKLDSWNSTKDSEDSKAKSILDEKNKKTQELKKIPEEFNEQEIIDRYQKQYFDKEFEEIQSLKDLISKKEFSIKELENDLSLYPYEEEKIDKLKKDISSIEYELKDKKNDKQLFEKGVCPTCGREIEPIEIADLDKKIENLEKRKDSLEEDLLVQTGNKKEYETISKNIEDFKRDKEKKLNELNQHKSKVESLELDKEKTIKYEREKFLSNRKNLKEKIESLEKSFDEKISYVNNIENEIEEVTKEIDSIKKKIKSYENVNEDELEVKRSKLKEVDKEINLYNEIIISNKEKSEINERLEKEEKERDAKLEEKEKEKDSLSNDLEKYKLAKKIFSREFPAYVLSNLVRTLEVTVNEFLSRVYPQYEISIKEDKNSLKITYGENQSDVRMASGFEKQIFSFSYKYALGKIQTYEILFLDEVDSAASVANSRKFYETIGKMESCFKQLFVITHKDEIKELLSNDYQATVFQVSNGTYEVY